MNFLCISTVKYGVFEQASQNTSHTVTVIEFTWCALWATICTNSCSLFYTAGQCRIDNAVVKIAPDLNHLMFHLINVVDVW